MTKPCYIVEWIYTSIPAQRFRTIVAEICLPSPDRFADARTSTNPRTGICPRSWEVRVDRQAFLSLKSLPFPCRIPGQARAWAETRETCRQAGLSFLVCIHMSPDEWSMQFIHDQCPQNKMSCEAPRKPAKEPTS